MKYRLSVPRLWRYRDHGRVYRELAPGIYTVPDHVPLDIAQLAVDQGMATLKPLPQEAKPVPASESAQPDHGSGRRWRGRRKTPAPENKIVHAPANKTTLV